MLRQGKRAEERSDDLVNHELQMINANTNRADFALAA